MRITTSKNGRPALLSVVKCTQQKKCESSYGHHVMMLEWSLLLYTAYRSIHFSNSTHRYLHIDHITWVILMLICFVDRDLLDYMWLMDYPPSLKLKVSNIN